MMKTMSVIHSLRHRLVSTAGIDYLYHGLRILNKPGIRVYFIIPLLTNMLVFGLLLYWLVQYTATIIGDIDPYVPDFLEDLAIAWLWTYLFSMVLLIVNLFSSLAMIIAAPFNGLLAEAVEYDQTGEYPPGGFWDAVVDFLPAMLNEVYKLSYRLVITVLALVLIFIPYVNVLVPFIWFLVQSWLFGFEYLDYPLDNHGLRLRQQRRLLRKHRMLTTSFGGWIMLFNLVPVINILVMPAAVAGATLLMLDKLETVQYQARKP
jgi:CysZ protein